MECYATPYPLAPTHLANMEGPARLTVGPSGWVTTSTAVFRPSSGGYGHLPRSGSGYVPHKDGSCIPTYGPCIVGANTWSGKAIHDNEFFPLRPSVKATDLESAAQYVTAAPQQHSTPPYVSPATVWRDIAVTPSTTGLYGKRLSPIAYNSSNGVERVHGMDQKAREADEKEVEKQVQEKKTDVEKQRKPPRSVGKKPTLSRGSADAKRRPTSRRPIEETDTAPKQARKGTPDKRQGRQQSQEQEEGPSKPKRVVMARPRRPVPGGGPVGALQWKRARAQLKREEVKRRRSQRRKMLASYESRLYYHYELPTVCKLMCCKIPELLLPPCLSTTPVYDLSTSLGAGTHYGGVK